MNKRRIFILTLILSCIGLFGAASVFGASASVSVSNGSPTVGSSVSVNVYYSGAQFGAADAVVSYNPDVLEFTGSNIVAQGGGGSVRLSMVSTGSSSLSGSLSFKVIGSGSSNISMSTSSLSDANANMLSVNSSSTSLSAQAKNSSSSSSSSSSDSKDENKNKDKDKKDKDKNKDKDKDDSKDEKRDASITLKSLDISCGKLTPSFSPNKYTYTLYVDKKDKECIISATPSSSKSKVKISGSSKLDGNPQKRVITVIAEDGSEGTYTINIEYGSDEKIMINGTAFVPVSNPDISQVPEGFKKSTAKFKGNKMDVLKSKDGKIVLVQLKPKDNSSKGQWFVYNEDKESFDPAEIVEVKGKKFIKIGSGYDLLYGKDGKATGYMMYDPETGKLAYVDFDYNGDGIKDSSNSPATVILLAVTLALLAVVLIVQFALIKRRGLGPKKVKNSKAAGNAKAKSKATKPENMTPADASQVAPAIRASQSGTNSASSAQRAMPKVDEAPEIPKKKASAKTAVIDKKTLFGKEKHKPKH